MIFVRETFLLFQLEHSPQKLPLASFSSAAGIAAIKGNQVFGPYGNARDSQGTINTAKGFTGQYNDSLTGLDYYGSRYYDQVAGVFLSADIKQGNMQGMNPYAYVGGNPETRNDPSGQMFAPPGGGGGGPSSSPTPTTSTVTPWWQQGLNVLGTAVHTVATTAVSVADFVTGASSMISDVQTLFDSKTSLWQKVLAGGDLLLNASMDVMMLTGIGEGLRGAELLLKGGIDLAEHVGEDMLAHEGEQVLAHEGESTLAHVTEGGGCMGLSFAPATLVATARGEQAIGKLHVGDKVWAYNPKTHQMELEPVLHVWINHDNDLVDLTLITINHAPHSAVGTKTSETIHTNKKHPFLTKEKGFLPVAKIKLGMHVLRADGTYGVVIGWKVVPGSKVMYNLEVAQDHTYTVGTGQWVVHNASCTVKDLDPLHSPETSGRRPKLENLSDQELLDSVNNPKYGDPIRISTKTGKVVNGNGRAYELLRRAALPGSSITPDTPIYYEPYTPSSIPEPGEEPPDLWGLLNGG
jgi:RHS repeat-associated protein